MSATDTDHHGPSITRTSSVILDRISIDGRQLLINGHPFIMKGICYSPVRKGGSFPADLMINKPTKEDLAVIEHDFQMMHQAGINTIRSYDPILDSRILELLTKYQLRTIVPVCSSFQVTPLKISSTIKLLKNHSSTLLWEVGNEWDLNYFYSKNIQHSDGIGFNGSFEFLEKTTKYIKRLDRRHPVSTGISGKLLNNQSRLSSITKLDSLDLLAMNIYDGLSFGNRFERWASHTTKPLYLGECGSDAFNTTLQAEDDRSQETAIRSLITEIHDNLSAFNPNHVLVGGCLFEWNDEWWKDDQGSNAKHDNGGIKSPGEGPYSDYVFNEEWWGVVDIDRHPRPAYFTIKELYTHHE